MVKLKLKNCQSLLDLYTYTNYYYYVVYQLMYENVYGKTPPPRFVENAVTLSLDVDRPCFKRNHNTTQIISSNYNKKTSLCVLNLLQKKIRRNKIGICSILGRIRIRIQFRTRIRIHYPGSGSAESDLDPHQNEADPKHWYCT